MEHNGTIGTTPAPQRPFKLSVPLPRVSRRGGRGGGPVEAPLDYAAFPRSFFFNADFCFPGGSVRSTTGS